MGIVLWGRQRPIVADGARANMARMAGVERFSSVFFSVRGVPDS
jgi:hypothetical protein